MFKVDTKYNGVIGDECSKEFKSSQIINIA